MDGRRSLSDSNGSASPRGSTARRRSAEEATSPPKRLRLGFDTYSPSGQETSPTTSHPLDSRKSSMSWQLRPITELPRIHEDVTHRAWYADSYVFLSLLHEAEEDN